MWQPQPGLIPASEAWILSGGAHHSVLSYSLTAEHMRAFAEIMDIELIHIHTGTDPDELSERLKLNDVMWKLRS
jgi:L-arabinose isomerase